MDHLFGAARAFSFEGLAAGPRWAQCAAIASGYSIRAENRGFSARHLLVRAAAAGDADRKFRDVRPGGLVRVRVVSCI